MRFLQLFLALYLLFLTLNPCQDRDECAATESTAIAQQDHRNHSEEPEACSPLCLCACCSQISIGSEGTTGFSTTLFVAETQQNTHYLNHYSLDLIDDCWQPPRKG